PLICDPARIKGMSEKLLVSHYENNYGGAVNRLHCPLIDELVVAQRPSQQHPSRAATLRFAHGREFSAPAIDASEITGERVAQLAFRRALFIKRGKEQLVQDH